MDAPIDVTRVLRPKPSVIVRQLGDESVLLDIETGCYFGLNEVGTQVWDRLGQGKSIDRIVVELLDLFSVSREQCEADVLEISRQMLDAGLIVSAAGSETER